MSSVIHYKFKNQATDWSTIHFDGTVLSTLDCKRSIILSKRLAKTTGVCEFDLLLTNAQTGEEYKNDHILINKNTSLIVRRLPAQRAKPLILELPKSVHTDSLGLDSAGITALQHGTAINEIPVSTKKEEDEQILAVMNDTAAQYRGFLGTNANKQQQHITPNSKPPANYTCHRCGKTGEHYIKFCPTNGDPQYDGPKKYMKYGNNPTTNQQLQDQANRQFLAPVVTASTTDPNAVQTSDNLNDTVESINDTTIPNDLICSIDKQLFKDAVETPCCGTNYCDECIRQYLIANDYICPNCNQPGIDITQLQPNQTLRERADVYRNKFEQEQSEALARSKSKSFERQHDTMRSNSRPPADDRPYEPRGYRGRGSKYREYNDYRNGRNQYDSQQQYDNRQYNANRPQQYNNNQSYNQAPPQQQQQEMPPLPMNPMMFAAMQAAQQGNTGAAPPMPMMPMLPLPGMPLPNMPLTRQQYNNRPQRSNSRTRPDDRYDNRYRSRSPRSHSRSQHYQDDRAQTERSFSSRERYNRSDRDRPYDNREQQYNDRYESNRGRPYNRQRSRSPQRQLSPVRESQERVLAPPILADNKNLDIGKRMIRNR